MRTRMPGLGKAAVLTERCYSVHIHSLSDRAKRVGREGEIWENTERERRPMGRDSPDRLGQRPPAASLATSGLITALESAAPALVRQAENLQRQLRESIVEVRALSHGLAPVA